MPIGEGDQREAGWQVTLVHGPDTVQFRCAEGSTVKSAGLRAGVRLRMACCAGGCGACRAHLLAGRTTYREPVSAKYREHADGNRYELLCLAIPASDVILAPLSPWSIRNESPLSTLVRRHQTRGANRCLSKLDE